MGDFSMAIPDPVLFALDRLGKRGFEAYCVGGCVRDSIMGIVPKDYDVTTSASPAEVLGAFEDCRMVETGLKHGTVTLVHGGMNIEITTYRIDGNYSDGRHPDSVSFTDSLSEDLKRRDFTVNAMAYSPETGLVDLFGGVDDIEKKTVRCVGRARDRFSEDGLRILRALRFSSVLDFSPDRECGSAVRKMSGLLTGISRERICSELSKLLTGRGASGMISRYPEVIAVSLSCPADTVRQGGKNIRRDERLFPDGTDGAVLRFAELLESAGDGATGIFSSLKPSRRESSEFKRFVKYGGFRCMSEYDVLKLISETDDAFPPLLARYLASCGRIGKDEALSMCRCHRDITEAGRCRNLKMLAVSGADLASEGVEASRIGIVLSSLLDSVMRGRTENSRKPLLELARLIRDGEEA